MLFPVAGPAHFSDDFHAPRSGGRVHLGNDIFGAEGTPLVAVEDGNVRFGTDPLGGNIANLRVGDGTRYYYAHLQGFEGENRAVRAGDVIGYLGRTGNAATTDAHLHFEVHPNGGEAVNPFPFLTEASRVETQAAHGSGSSTPIWPWFLLAGALGAGYYHRRALARILR